MNADPIVFVVDPDPGTRQAVCDLVSTMNLCCETYASGLEFLDAYQADQPGCVVLEVRIPDINGLEIQSRLAARGVGIPMVFLAGQGTVSIAVRAMRHGALHFLEKPFREHELWDAIQEAIASDGRRRAAAVEQQLVVRNLARLTPRERQVLEMIAVGKSKKTIAAELGVCVRTVELRRNEVMKKLGANSLAELVRLALLAEGTQLPVRRSHSETPDLAAVVSVTF